MSPEPTKHGATFCSEILKAIRELTPDIPLSTRALEPFAGVGTGHQLGFDSLGVELEREWACQHDRNIVGDVLHLDDVLPRGMRFGLAYSSPCYGNRFADKDFRDSAAGNYAKWLGRLASDGSSCHMQWGRRYKEFHVEAWRQVVDRLDGPFLLNISDHKRCTEPFRRAKVTDFHIGVFNDLGFRVVACVPVETPRLQYGANPLRMPAEMIIRFERS